MSKQAERKRQAKRSRSKESRRKRGRVSTGRMSTAEKAGMQTKRRAPGGRGQSSLSRGAHEVKEA
jgi:hypothetical protein